MNFIKSNFDFKFYGASWIALLVFILIFPMLAFLPQEYGYENGLLENIQMCVLFISIYLCFTAKFNKRFFKFCIFVLTILIIREVNCGRTLFFPIPGKYHQYYSWRDLPYPWLGKIAHSLYALWIAIVGFIFFKNKIFIDLFELIKKIKLPFWNLFFAIISMFMGAIAEKATNNNFIFEEGFELLFYVSVAGIIWLYSRNKNFLFNKQNNL